MEYSAFHLNLLGFMIQLVGLIGNLLFLPLTVRDSSRRRPRISIKLNNFFNDQSLREKAAFIFSYVLIFGMLLQILGFIASLSEDIHQTSKLLSEIDELKIENTRLANEIDDLRHKIKFGLIGPEYNE